MKNDGVDHVYKKKIIGIIQVLFPGAKIYLYGSRARGQFRETSDIDIAIDAGAKVYLGEARALLEAMMIPLRIDIVDLHAASESFKNEIMKDAIVWNI